ncbi:hypothetical protein HWB90_gp108 [Mycobacterium phage Fowlmouth]|uniref:Uncharacterized protein n=1 Tax=Mycobacterium phage Fowlmouth TaxID=2419978 RepID=A0A3G2KGF5_9CAUD|nr:hypothetical protein HWB90_gp108 [Mycobacterium phage Fowlmouth]AYN58031.1 hypothetical protein SEA_FOWLMOUTH_82 [Mycobacterium phage Fowlmouth]
MSSGIQVILPIEVFGSAENLTPQAITEALTKAKENTEQLSKSKETINLLLRIIKEQGNRLENIVEGGHSGMEQAKRVREMIRDLKTFDIREDLK